MKKYYLIGGIAAGFILIVIVILGIRFDDNVPVGNEEVKSEELGKALKLNQINKKSLKIDNKERIGLYKKVINNTLSESDFSDITTIFNKEIKDKKKELKLKVNLDNQKLGATVDNNQIMIGNNLTQEQILKTLEVILLSLED